MDRSGRPLLKFFSSTDGMDIEFLFDGLCRLLNVVDRCLMGHQCGQKVLGEE